MIASLSPLPPLCVGIPNTVGEQTIQIGKVGIAVDEEVQAFAIVLARPLAVPDFASRLVRVEVRAAQCLPTAMWTAFNVAASAMALADGRAAIGTGSERLAHEYLATHNAHSRQKFLNRVGDSSVYRTVCWIFL
jgi:hypothetical protein